MSTCKNCFTKLVSTTIAVVGTNLQITVVGPTALDPSTKYCLVLTSPLPEAGESLPVTILLSGGTTAIPLHKTICRITSSCGKTAQCTFGDVEYGIDLPERGRTRIPLYLNNNMADFYDLRGVEHLRRCREV